MALQVPETEKMSDYFMKLVLVGEGGVGKTSLIDNFLGKEFRNHYSPTIGAELSKVDFEIGDKRVTVSIWETPGIERFRCMPPLHYRGADCLILVFDATNMPSFDNLDRLYAEFVESNGVFPLDIPCALLGNKVDAPDGVVSEEIARRWCASKGNIPYFETSAKEGDRVRMAFESVIVAAFNRAALADSRARAAASKPSSDGGGSGGAASSAAAAQSSSSSSGLNSWISVGVTAQD